MKKILLVLLTLCLLCSLIACDKGDDPETNDTTPETNDALSETEWKAMISDDVLANYTVMMEGKMSVTENGVADGSGEQNIKQIIKVANNMLSIEMFVDGESVEPIVLEGDLAAKQNEQATQLFKIMLAKYDAFTYDKEKKVYTVSEPVTIETVLAGFSYNPDGSMVEFDVPAVIEMRDATVTVSENGQLVSFDCDYSQSMTMSEDTVVTSGLVTWTFSDFGTTVIENSAN